MNTPSPSPPTTRGALRASGWTSRSVRDELRENLIAAMKTRTATAERWPGIHGYEHTVIPQLENAILSKHDFILLGLRGQGKTRILRQLSEFLDPWLPALDGCDLNDDPFSPISRRGTALVETRGDDAPIRWIPRAARYQEKLATPDVTIADLIGDVDPIKAANERISLDDEDALQFGLIPRTNRGIVAMNEIPDLAPRIQVGLLNLLEERDVQLRGHPIRLPLDVLLVFSANPEDYTNRGSIITPLRDRIASQILTHYPRDLETARTITDQEAYVNRGDVRIHIPWFLREAIERCAFEARKSTFVDQSSGVSARLPISLLENVISNAERRALQQNAREASARVADVFAALSAVTGKIELVFEGEREGPAAVAERIVGEGIAATFGDYFPPPYERNERASTAEPIDDPYKAIVDWFAEGHAVVVQDQTDMQAALSAVPTLHELVHQYLNPSGGRMSAAELNAGCELVLEGLHQASLLAKDSSPDGIQYGDMLKRMFAGFGE